MGKERFCIFAALAGAFIAMAACAPVASERSVSVSNMPIVAQIDRAQIDRAPSDRTPTGQTQADGTQAGGRAARLAQNLALAELAHDQGARARLGELVGTLYASGLSPRSEQQTDMLAKWVAASGQEMAPYRGRLLGPAYVRGELEPGQRWESAQTFKSGEPSTLAVSHKGAGPVSISVSDQRSRSVCSVNAKPTPACRFTPLYTQRYSIELVNEGPERAVYFLVFD